MGDKKVADDLKTTISNAKDISERANKVLGKVDNLLVEVESIVGNNDFKDSVVEMSKNFKSASENVNQLTETLNRVATNNENNINDIASKLNTLLTTMNSTMANVEHMTANIDTFAGNPQTAVELKETLSDIAATSKNVASIAENMNGVLGDKKVAEDLKTTISNAKDISERANKVLGKVEGVSSIEVSPSVEMLYSGKKHDWNTNFDLEISKDDKSLNLGVEDIGDNAKFNAQLGKRWNDFGVAWIKEFLMQNIKNLVKAILIRIRQ